MFLDALNDPDHEDHQQLMDWYGKPFDVHDIEPDIVNIQMGRLAAMRCPKQ